MTDDTTPEADVLTAGLAKLAEPFHDAQVGKLPRVTCRKCRDTAGKVCADHNKTRCDACGQYMTTAHMHIDYVGHAQVTARLLEVDPCWTWEPVAWDVNGMPAIAEEQNGRRVLWIRMTVLGVTRLGVGIAGNHEEVEKILVGDAIRNCAMRYGVALDLWAKGELHAPEDNDAPPPGPSAPVTQAPPGVDWKALGFDDQDAHDGQWEQCKAVARRLPSPHFDNVRDWVKADGNGPPFTKAFLIEWAEMMDSLTAPEPAADPTPEGEPPLPGVDD